MDNLKELRNEKGLTQQQVADLVGISLRSYKYYENEPDKRIPRNARQLHPFLLKKLDK